MPIDTMLDHFRLLGLVGFIVAPIAIGLCICPIRINRLPELQEHERTGGRDE